MILSFTSKDGKVAAVALTKDVNKVMDQKTLSEQGSKASSIMKREGV